MGKVITALLGIGLIVVLYLGHSHWNELQTAEAKDKKITNVEQKNSSSKTNKKKGKTAEVDSVDFTAYMKNWPEGAANQFEKKLEENTTYKILFVGSTSMGTETDGTYPLVKQELLDTFGEDHVEVDLMTFSSTSTELIKAGKQADIASSYADLIVFEPFMITNNGNLVPTSNTLADLKTVIDDVHAVKPETTFIIQPPNPIYKAKNYPIQVEALKKFATDNKLTYLDHWTAWPDFNSDEFKDYVTADQTAPSEIGIKIWSKALTDFLISK